MLNFKEFIAQSSQLMGANNKLKQLAQDVKLGATKFTTPNNAPMNPTQAQDAKTLQNKAAEMLRLKQQADGQNALKAADDILSQLK